MKWIRLYIIEVLLWYYYSEISFLKHTILKYLWFSIILQQLSTAPLHMSFSSLLCLPGLHSMFHKYWQTWRLYRHHFLTHSINHQKFICCFFLHRSFYFSICLFLIHSFKHFFFLSLFFSLWLCYFIICQFDHSQQTINNLHFISDIHSIYLPSLLAITSLSRYFFLFFSFLSFFLSFFLAVSFFPPFLSLLFLLFFNVGPPC